MRHGTWEGRQEAWRRAWVVEGPGVPLRVVVEATGYTRWTVASWRKQTAYWEGWKQSRSLVVENDDPNPLPQHADELTAAIRRGQARFLAEADAWWAAHPEIPRNAGV